MEWRRPFSGISAFCSSSFIYPGFPGELALHSPAFPLSFLWKRGVYENFWERSSEAEVQGQDGAVH